MFKRISQFLAIGIISFTSHLSAQSLPYVYDQENTGEDCPDIYTPSFGELPAIGSLPNPFEWSDGRGTIENVSDWKCRRNEIATEIQQYEIGQKPSAPEDIEASFSNNTLTVKVTRNGETLTLSSSIDLPDGDGPHPVLIGMGFNPIPGSLTSPRDIATMNFSHDQVTSYSGPSTSDPYFELYPQYSPSSVGQYSAWVWGVSRLIDGLEMVSEEANIDVQHIGVSGCSYAGKMAIFSGAFDERIALTFGIESGGGGYTTWRYSEVINQTESVETLGKTDYNWFMDGMNQFASNVNKLPMDHHELMAMVAPRALFVTGNPGWTWLADESGYVGSRATKEVYKALGIEDRFGYSQIGGHNHCTIPGDQYSEIESFLDKFLLGDETVETNVATTPYSTNLDNWITWETPTLGTDSSYMGTTELVSPEDGASGLDTSLTFSWEELDDAELYYFELSPTGAFQTIVASDSTTNTEITIDDLGKGDQYYWRIRVKNSAGEKGPWTYPSKFITFVKLPEVPILLDGILTSPTRTNYMDLTWINDPWTDSYTVQVSKDSSFGNVNQTITTSDTTVTAVIRGASEGDLFFWRVRATNLAGISEWSNTSSIYIFSYPDDFSASINDSGVELSWDDNSDIEEGYQIERKYGEDTYAIIDTVEADIEEYTDLSADLSNELITYRIRAFEGSNFSSYSEEAEISQVSNEFPEDIPGEFSIRQNYPNPFNPTTLIEFSVPQATYTTLTVYDVLGREIQTLVNGVIKAGNHTAFFDAGDIPSGVYLYTIQSGTFSETKKMMLLK